MPQICASCGHCPITVGSLAIAQLGSGCGQLPRSSGVASATTLPAESSVTGFTGWRTSAHVGDGRNATPLVFARPSSTATVDVLFSNSGTSGTTGIELTVSVAEQSDLNRVVGPSETSVGIFCADAAAAIASAAARYFVMRLS